MFLSAAFFIWTRTFRLVFYPLVLPWAKAMILMMTMIWKTQKSRAHQALRYADCMGWNQVFTWRMMES